MASIAFHVYTIWLFTYTDLKTIVIPQSAFGIIYLASSLPSTTSSIPMLISNLIRRSPAVIFWTWINLLPFTISNQRQVGAIHEDAINKPWRPLPSGRSSFQQATTLMRIFYVLAYITSFFLGGSAQCLILICLGYWYNDLGGGDTSCIVRNFINACGFLCFASGAADVAASGQVPSALTGVSMQWLLVVGSVVFTTVHSQDMYDQAGDRMRGRWTVPLSMGDVPARYTIAAAVVWWSWYCPSFWNLGTYCRTIPVATGVTVAQRTLWKRSVESDKLTFRIWNLWMVVLYLLPLMRRFSASPSDQMKQL